MNKPETVIPSDVAGPRPRHTTTQVMVGNVAVGGGAPIVVQSMTNTDTADIEGTIAQVAALSRAGSEMVRITVDREEAASAVPHIRDGLRKSGITTPLIGDFHYIGHKLLADYPACAEALDKYRINPGNVGFKNKRDTQFADIIEIANKNNKPVRMGSKGIVASSAALGILLQDGIGDTIRISLTPEPGGDRTLEVQVAQELLQTMGFRTFVPLVAACPGCGRTTSTTFQELARSIQDFIRDEMPGWK